MIDKLQRIFIQNHQNYRTYLSLNVAFFLVFIAISIATIGLMWIDDYALVEAFYMSIITISTVGFTEVRPLSPNGQLFISIMILFNIGVYIYSAAAFTQFIIHGELFKLLHMDLLNKDISKLNNHVIICGYGKYGKEITHQFLTNKIPFVIIEIDENKIQEIQLHKDNFSYIHDDATHDEALEKAGIHRAKALVSAMADDTDNVFTVLTARQLNSSINIILLGQ